MNHRIKENRLRGSDAYPFALYEMPPGDAVLSAAMHWQDDTEVLCIRRGDVVLTLDGRRIILHAGDTVWINPGQLHGFQGISPDARCEIFIFPVQHLLFASEDHDQLGFLRPLSEGLLGFPAFLPCEAARCLQDRIIALQTQRPAAYELLTKALLLQLICLLAQSNAFVPLQPARHDDVCKQILLYIRRHYAEKLTVPRMAQAVAIAPTYFSAFFLKHFFRRFTEYLRDYRIEQACTLLQNTSLSVTEIALSTGFNSASHFIRNFRAVTGTTPQAYRRSGA